MSVKPELIVEKLRHEAGKFAEIETKCHEPTLYGVKDDKAVGTYLEHKFTAYLAENDHWGDQSEIKWQKNP